MSESNEFRSVKVSELLLSFIVGCVAFAGALFALAIMLMGFYALVGAIGRHPSDGVVLAESVLFWLGLAASGLLLVGGCIGSARATDVNPLISLLVAFLLAGFSALPVSGIIAETNECLHGPPVVLLDNGGSGCSR